MGTTRATPLRRLPSAEVMGRVGADDEICPDQREPTGFFRRMKPVKGTVIQTPAFLEAIAAGT